MPIFPDYGELLLSGYNEKTASSLLRTQMEDGPDKQAKVRSQEQVGRNVTYRFSSAEFITWKAWRKDDIASGALFFDWISPLTGDTVQGRIVDGVYDAKPFNGNGDSLNWDVSFMLETYE